MQLIQDAGGQGNCVMRQRGGTADACLILKSENDLLSPMHRRAIIDRTAPERLGVWFAVSCFRKVLGGGK